MRPSPRSRRYLLVLTIALFCVAVTAGRKALAQDAVQGAFPDRPIRLIVPYPPGGPTDVMGRLISQSLSATFRQQVYVDNRPGAGSTLGGKVAAVADPDGYTLLLGSAATLAIGPALYPDAGLDPSIFVPVAMFSSVPFVMIAGPKAPVGKDTNWIPTNPHGMFETLFRLYGPKKPLFDKTWALPDIEKIG